MSWLRTYILICAGVMVSILLLMVLLLAFVDLGLSTNGTVALLLGVLFTVGLAMGLMGLVFHSSRSGGDQMAHGEARQKSFRAHDRQD